MTYEYACRLNPEEDGGFFVTFPDVPEALTGGADREETLELAADALGEVLVAYVRDKRQIPAPGKAHAGCVMVRVPEFAVRELERYSGRKQPPSTPEVTVR